MGRNSLGLDKLYKNRTSNGLLTSESDILMFERLHKIVLCNKFTFITVLKSNKCSDMLKWIYGKTCSLNDQRFRYTLGTRLVWIYLGLTDFPKCPTCGNTIGLNVNVTFNRSYSSHCSNRCLGKDPATILKKEATNLAHRGVKYPSQDPNRRKTEKRIKQKLGWTQTSREKAMNTYRSRTGYDWPTQNPDVISKIESNNLRKYGHRHIAQVPEFQKRRVESYKKLHNGVGSPGALPEIIEKKADTYEKKTGYRNPLCNPEVRAEIGKTNIRLYGDIYPARTEQVKAKIENTRLSKYGIKCVPSGRLRYEGERFDSEAELAYWIYSKDKGISIRRCTEAEVLTFEFDGKTIGYYCDFISDGTRIEIKGDHFFRNGKMICPYRKKEWTDERYARQCAIYEAKHQCMLVNGVRILLYSGDEVQAALKYVRETYGNGYLR